MTNRQDAEAVLAAWREVERALAREGSGSDEAEELQTEALRLRDHYQALIDQAELAHGDDSPAGWLDGERFPDLTGSA